MEARRPDAFHLPAPNEVRAEFSRLAALDAERACAYLYELGARSGYIKQDASNRNLEWTAPGAFGTLECTINLAKPEKDPRAIAAAAAAGTTGAAATPATAPAPDGEPPRIPPTPTDPLCDLCWENELFPGSPTHPAKPGLRIAAIELGGERWGLQYSPYAYFPEHCIALAAEHRPMRIDAACFERLLDFADLFPFYFIGSNADLPIVGGSILSHDHFQGGRHRFPLMRAPIERTVVLPETPQVSCGIVRWHASVLRLASPSREQLSRAAERILAVWQGYSNDACGIRAHSGAIPHNTLNPIVRKNAETGVYTADLVLRNNRADEAHPWGIFHPGGELHHIKKENIGLVEIMGRAILPARLAQELPAVQDVLCTAVRKGRDSRWVHRRIAEASPQLAPHASWAADIYTRHAPAFAEQTATLHPIMLQEVAKAFAHILDATAVFKPTQAGTAGWKDFLAHLKR